MQNQTWFDAQIERIDRSQAEIHKQMAALSRLSRWDDGGILAFAALLGVVAAIAARAPEIIQALR